MPKPVTPLVSVDIIYEPEPNCVLLIERKYEPFGWAIPGGFIDVGETAEKAAFREMEEETSVQLSEVRQFHVYSDPKRDARGHSISIAFIAKAKPGQQPRASDDAKNCKIFRLDDLPKDLCFDHPQMLKEYAHYKKTGKRPDERSDEKS